MMCAKFFCGASPDGAARQAIILSSKLILPTVISLYLLIIVSICVCVF